MNNCSDFGRASFVNLVETREHDASDGVVFDPDPIITDKIFEQRVSPLVMTRVSSNESGPPTKDGDYLLDWVKFYLLKTI